MKNRRACVRGFITFLIPFFILSHPLKRVFSHQSWVRFGNYGIVDDLTNHTLCKPPHVNYLQPS